ncbi:CaiB/BaiF CoA transferase family protein [Prauserella endophytica]|uniref:CoA transferase n=1 Tax=Prauserella endophytica TaxID=1592324 RepID=A0ABY2S0R7_9PSEU|nr:CaiB/BaiF CoA-transferase family protein [Prauserella endophytica]TKG65765.1 CoA transferase [Prauserella endophytica]
MNPAGGPLGGRTVVELAGIGPAPFAGMMLGDLGAEVIRIERPTASGGAPPPRAADILNRGKKSVVLDLKKPAGVDAVHAIVERADVLIEGFRPGVAERLGVGPGDVRSRNPQLVYGRMTGWGQDGPLAHTAGHDIGYIALTGALGAIGAAGGPPQVPLNLLGDFGGGATYLVIGVLAALLEADTTGRGQVVDAAIVDGVSHLLAAIHSMLGSGRWADQRGANLLDGAAPFYTVYETADGGHVAVGAIEPKFYAELLRLLDIDRAEAAPGDQYDRDRWPDLRSVLARAFSLRTRDAWAEHFAGTDACVTPVLSLKEAIEHPHLAHRRSLVESHGVLQPGTAPRLDGHATRAPRQAPRPGQDTENVLRDSGLDARGLIEKRIAMRANTG